MGQVRRLYGDLFRYVIFHNGLNERQLARVRLLGCEMFDQTEYAETLVLPPPRTDACGPAWKLYPPRLSFDAHEILMDNDLILVSRLAVLEKFLDGELAIASRAVQRRFGVFDHHVRPGFLLNSGLLCLPPRLPWRELLNRQVQTVGLQEWTGHFDEQGLVASVFQDLPHQITDEIIVSWTELEYQHSDKAMHFVGLNKGDAKHWLKYCNKRVAIL